MLELAPGTAFGAYVITARLGRGGMAVVYRAHHAALDRDVAIKVLWPSLAQTPGFAERFRREARAASRLRHPNILSVYDFGTQDGITYMVTELLPGGSLADLLARPVPIETALRVVKGIGAALDAAHAAGLIHRDVKPSNILFTADGQPVLADFGIARMIDGESQITVQGSLIGTPHYLAPEMASGDEVGPASDLYSLGVVLFEMLTGGPPFPRATPIATVRAHIQETPPPIQTLNPALPIEVEAVVSRALAKRPEDRYPSGAALAIAFEQAISGSERPTPPIGTMQQIHRRGRTGDPIPRAEPPNAIIPGPPRPYPARPTARPRRRRSLVPLLVLIAVCLIAAAGAFAWRASGGTGLVGPTPTRIAEGAVPGSSPIPSTVPATVAPGASPTIVVTQPAASPVSSPSAAASPATSPEIVVFPTNTPRPPPTPTPPSPPTATPDPRRGPLAVQILSPANGEAVTAHPTIAGLRSGLQGPDEHLWLLIHPRGAGPENWWPLKRELIADRDGRWQVDDLEIAGPPGSMHDLAVGVVDAAGNQRILDQIQNHQDEPFSDGQPPGFRELARITVVKR